METENNTIIKKHLGESWAIIFDSVFEKGYDEYSEYYSIIIPIKIKKVNVMEVIDYDDYGEFTRFIIDNNEYSHYKLFNTYEGAVRYLKATKEETEEKIKRLLNVFENYNKLMKDIE